MIEWLEAMKKVPLYVKNISISSDNEEELENIIDPNLQNTSMDNLELTLLGYAEISAKTIENLKTIYPNSIWLLVVGYGEETRDESRFRNFTKLLSNLDQTSLKMGCDGDYLKLKFEFSNVILKVVESNEECFYIRAKLVKIQWLGGDFCWIK